MRLTGHGISAGLPRGWEGAIVRQAPVDVAASQHYALSDDDLRTSAAVLTSLPVVHLANFPLPSDRGDFGSGAVELMGPDEVFVSLVEYGPENLGTELFSDPAPIRLRPAMFAANGLQRTLPGQAGYQTFFTAQGRPFSLYVVLGGTSQAEGLVDAVNVVLGDLEIGSA